MAFQKPEITEDSDLKQLLKDAQAAAKPLSKIKPEEVTDEQLKDIEAIAETVTSIKAAEAERAAAIQQRVDAVNAARAALDQSIADPEEEGADEEPADEPSGDETPADAPPAEEPAPVEEPAPTEPPADAPVDAPPADGGDLPPIDDTPIPDDASEIIDEEEKETVTASAGSVASRVRGGAPAPERQDPTPPSRREGWNTEMATITASADVPGFVAGSDLADNGAVARAFAAKSRSFPTNPAVGARGDYQIASYKKVVDDTFRIDGSESADQVMEKIRAAGDERRLEGESIVAAGGWCSPSETVYNIPQIATVSGILSVPEVVIERGGLSFTKGPDFSAVFADTGFVQTEAQAEAGATKHFTTVDCPPFEEVRLDAIGYGLEAPILTNAAYPELISWYVDATQIAHAHKMNAAKQSRINALITDSITARQLGSVTADSLEAVELAVQRLRYKWRLDQNSSVEGFAPDWVKATFRAELARRQQIDFLSVTDAMIDAWFRERHVALQWVYDTAQDLPGNATDYPETATISLYPAGTFVVGTSDVINLSAIYDRPKLDVNVYTVMFMEEGLLVMSQQGSGTKVTINTGARDGLTGAHIIGAPAADAGTGA